MKKPIRIQDYFILIYEPSHPRAFAAGYVPEHILVAEKYIGRSLSPDEDVRHINGNPHDNRQSNLEIISISNDFKTVSIDNTGTISVRAPQNISRKTFVPCAFQRPCWKNIRAPIARKHKVFLPFFCSFQQEGDIYKCGHFWNFFEADWEEKHKKEEEQKKER